MTLIGDSCPERLLSIEESIKWWGLSEIALDRLQSLYMSALYGSVPEDIYFYGERNCQYLAAWRKDAYRYRIQEEVPFPFQEE